MTRYALRRLLAAPLVLLAAVTLTFLLLRLTPGGPFDRERALPAEIRANLDAHYGLDRPLPEQYLAYLGGLLRGDLGPSLRYRDQPVAALIAAGLPASLLLGGLALALGVAGGVLLGARAGARPGGLADHCAGVVALGGLALPVFVLAPLAALAFGVWLGWLPAGGWQPGRVADLVLPVAVLALPVLAQVARLTRAGVRELATAPFVQAARARGLTDGRVLWRHQLPAALLPVVGFLGPAAAAVLAGSLVVETVFSVPGVGRHLVTAALNRDHTLVLGMVVVYATLLTLANLAADLLLGWLDPRLRRPAAPEPPS